MTNTSTIDTPAEIRDALCLVLDSDDLVAAQRIPNTVEGASRVLGSLGVSYVTMHAHGGADMLRAGVNGLREGATSAGLEAPAALAVTVLTSDNTAPDHIVPNRLRVAMEGGCQGIVCAATDLADISAIAPRMIKVTPGIRPAGASLDDQARVATPRDAIDAGSDLLVIGRPVTAAADAAVAAAAIVDELRA